MAVGRNYRIYHKYIQGAPYSLILENTRIGEEFLLFESNVVASLISKECEDFKKQYTKIADGYGCLGVLQLHGSNGQMMQYLCLVTACVSVGKIDECDVQRITGVQFLPMWAPLPPGVQGSLALDDRVADIQKLVSSGTFYFTWSAKEESLIDVSVCAQKRHQGQLSDSRFFWNRTLHLHLQRYGINTTKWLLKCVCGGVDIKTVYVGHKTAKACLISRLSCERMGTRFNVRGVNDSGHAANFVETEQVIYYDDNVVSFVQTRGSVPLFWEQPGVQVGSHKVKMCRAFEASAPAYDRHLKLMKNYYGEIVLANLLGVKEGEKVLSQAFETHHKNSCHCDDTLYVPFDYHALVRANNRPQNLVILWDKVKHRWQKFGFFHARGGEILRLQTGVIRTNCLDCLDRTNSAQAFFALQTLALQLQALDLVDKPQMPNFRSRFEEIYKQLWTTNGDQCSKIYAGTGALEGKSKVKDASRSVTRTIQNNFMDSSKQEAMDIFLLGTGLNSDLYDRARALLPVGLLQACPSVLALVVQRADEMTSPRKIRIFCGTWNVNGGQRFNSVVFRRDQSLADWLLDLPRKSATSTLVDVADASSDDDFSTATDIFVIGLEEIVDLNASNIVSASTTNQKLWSEALKKIVSRDHKHILIHSVQLVGVCLFVFVRPHLAPFIKEVATDVVKTGLGGATGNKGGVAVRFMVYSTSFCFLCSHFAAGQKEVADRNNDFAEICKKTQFPMGRGIFSHDFVFWLGDFNYRVDLGGEEVKQLVKERNLQPMIAADQLTVQRKAGNVFQGFREGPLTFAPTYKYDTFSDDYDTSEKCRTPAWTDRILWWQRPPFAPAKINDNDSTSAIFDSNTTPVDDGRCRLVHYGRAELKTSDHRPVGAIFDVSVREVDERRREEVFHSIVTRTGPPDATVLVSAPKRRPGEGFPPELMDGVLRKASELGVHVLLVKFVGDDMWLIFNDGEMALSALSMDGVQVGNEPIAVRLKSPHWEEECESELRQSRWMTDGDAKYSLLRDDAVQYDLDDEEAEEVANPVTGVLAAAPVDTISVSSGGSGRSTPTRQQVDVKAPPPPRPAAPPKRPPPPTAKAGSPVNAPEIASVNVTETALAPTQYPTWEDSVPVRSAPSQEMARPCSVATSNIGPPVNVKRYSARTPEEAESMIAELQGQRAKERTPPWPPATGAASPAEDDWADFLQTRSVGGSKFYAAPPEPTQTDFLAREWSEQPAPLGPPPAVQDVWLDKAPLPLNEAPPPPPRPLVQPPKSIDSTPTDPWMAPSQPPIPPRPPNYAPPPVNVVGIIAADAAAPPACPTAPPPIPARKAPQIPQ